MVNSDSNRTSPDNIDNKIGATDSESGEGSPEGRGPTCRGDGDSSFPGAPPSNTAPQTYNETTSDPHILRWGIDSLYLSFPGRLAKEWNDRLSRLKSFAQSRDDAEKAKAQVEIDEHLFEVNGKGYRRYPYVLQDGWFWIALSSAESQSLPLAYVQVSSLLILSLGYREAVNRLRHIINTFGAVIEEPNISRVDLCVDFTTDINIQTLSSDAWICRAQYMGTHSISRQRSGWSFGKGSPIMGRLYNKSLELTDFKKLIYTELWRRAGKDNQHSVWRMEFQFQRDPLKEMEISKLGDLEGNLRGLWQYATDKWLRLTQPNHSDSNIWRWPVHPLWSKLSLVDWDQPDTPTLHRVRKERVPSDETLFQNGMGYILSFMAREGITDLGEGFGEYLAHAQRFHDATGRGEGLGFHDYCRDKVAAKARKFNTLFNPNEDEEERIGQQADAYRREKDGE